MKFLFIETYYLGSHAHFVQGLSSYSSHDIDFVTMTGENWRWRMLGAALHIIDSIPPLDGYDGIIVTDLFNLADFKALVGQPCPPVLAYFHENQRIKYSNSDMCLKERRMKNGLNGVP